MYETAAAVVLGLANRSDDDTPPAACVTAAEAAAMFDIAVERVERWADDDVIELYGFRNGDPVYRLRDVRRLHLNR